MKHSDALTLTCTTMVATIGIVFSMAINLSLWSTWYNWVVMGLLPALLTNSILMGGCVLSVPACYLNMIIACQPQHSSRPLSVTSCLVCLLTAILVLLSLGLGAVSGLSGQLREPDGMRTAMQTALQNINISSSSLSDIAFNKMQQNLKCCGVDSPNDWLTVAGNCDNESLPISCCSSDSDKGMNSTCVLSRANMGCLRPAVMCLRCFLNSVTCITACMMIVTAIALTSNSFSLMRELVKRHEQHAESSMIGFSDRYLLPPVPAIATLITPAAVAAATAGLMPAFPSPTAPSLHGSNGINNRY